MEHKLRQMPTDEITVTTKGRISLFFKLLSAPSQTGTLYLYIFWLSVCLSFYLFYLFGIWAASVGACLRQENLINLLITTIIVITVIAFWQGVYFFTSPPLL